MRRGKIQLHDCFTKKNKIIMHFSRRDEKIYLSTRNEYKEEGASAVIFS